MSKWCCIGICGRISNEEGTETCTWFSLGFFTWWHSKNAWPITHEYTTICTPICSYYTGEESQTSIHGACTPCGCYEVRREANGTKELTIGTICCKTALTTPPQVTMGSP